MITKNLNKEPLKDSKPSELSIKLIPFVDEFGSFYDKIELYPTENNPITVMPNQLLLKETEKYKTDALTYARIASEKTVINGNIAEYFVTEFDKNGNQNILESNDQDTKIVRSFNLMIEYEDVPDHTSNFSAYGIEDMNIGTIHVPKLHFKEASKYASKKSDETTSPDKGFLIDDSKIFESLDAPKIGDLIKSRLDEVLYKIVFVDDGATEAGDFLSRQAYWTLSIRKYIDNHQGIDNKYDMADVMQDQIGDYVDQENADDIFDIKDYIKDRRDEVIYDDSDEHKQPPRNSNTVGKWF